MQMQMDIVVEIVSHFYINISLYTAYKGMAKSVIKIKVSAVNFLFKDI